MTGENRNKQLSFVVSLQVLLFGAKNALIEGIPFLYLINDQLNLIISGFVFFLYLYAFIISNKKFGGSKASATWWTIILLTFLYTFLFFPQNIQYLMRYLLRSAAICYFTCYLVSKIEDFKWLIHYLTMFSYLLIIASAISAFFVHTIGHVTTSDYEGDVYGMSLSYVSLAATMWLLYSYFDSKRIMPLLAALLGILIIILFGSRNPLLALFAYVMVQLFYNSNSSSHKNIYRVIMISCLICLPFYNQIIVALGSFASSVGFNSRTLRMLAEDEVDLSNRDEIHKELVVHIDDNWLTGLGVAGDYATIDESAHSFYLSVFCTYGYVIGIMFLITVTIMLIKAYVRSKGVDRGVLVLFLCLVLPRTFTGGDIWINDNFWWLMGIVLVILGRKKNYYQYVGFRIV